MIASLLIPQPEVRFVEQPRIHNHDIHKIHLDGRIPERCAGDNVLDRPENVHQQAGHRKAKSDFFHVQIPLSASFLYAAQSSQLSSCQYSSSSMKSHSSQSQSSSYSSQPSQWYFLFHQRDRSCHQHKGLKAVVILVIPLSQRDLIHALVAAAVKLFCQPHLTLLVFPALV